MCSVTSVVIYMTEHKTVINYCESSNWSQVPDKSQVPDTGLVSSDVVWDRRS